MLAEEIQEAFLAYSEKVELYLQLVAEQKIDQPTGVHPYGSYIVTDRTRNTTFLP
jgi:hypothetical protein